jgi:hydrogenase maturation protease
MTMQPVLVLGIGNILLGDEGVGVRVVEAMREADLPDGVELVDGGTCGADLIDLLADRRKVVVIDALEAGATAGSLFRLSAEDLLPEEGDSISLHQLGLVDSLAMVAQLGCAPQEVVVFGIQPATLRPGLELSPDVAAAVPGVIEAVLAELRQSHEPAAVASAV